MTVAVLAWGFNQSHTDTYVAMRWLTGRQQQSYPRGRMHV